MFKSWLWAVSVTLPQIHQLVVDKMVSLATLSPVILLEIPLLMISLDEKLGLMGLTIGFHAQSAFPLSLFQLQFERFNLRNLSFLKSTLIRPESGVCFG